MKNILPFIFGVICIVWIFGCSESDCSLNSSPMNSINFMSSETGKAIKLMDTLTVTAIGTDSTLINRITSVSTLSLPLKYIGGKTEYVFKYTLVRRDTIQIGQRDSIINQIFTVKDTVGVRYTDQKRFTSADCGILTYFNLDSIWTTHHLIDSAHITNPSIDEYEKTNIELFFPTGN